MSNKKIGFDRKASNNREIKSLENNLSIEATKNIINTPKIAIEKSPIVVKPNIVTPIKIATKPKIVDKPKIIIGKNINYNKYKNRVIKQLKNTLRSWLMIKKVNMMINAKE